MPRIPSAQKTELLSSGSRSNSGFAGRAQSGKQELPGKNWMKTEFVAQYKPNVFLYLFHRNERHANL